MGPISGPVERRQVVTLRDERQRPSRFALFTTSWDNDVMPNATITVDAALKERLADLASQSGQRVDEFVEALLRRIANADVRLIAAFQCFQDALALQRCPSKTLIASPKTSANDLANAVCRRSAGSLELSFH